MKHLLPILLASTLIATPARARGSDDLALDQVHLADGRIQSTISGDADKAQTFTVGLEGFLKRVDVFVLWGAREDPLLIDVRSTLDGAPTESDSSVLASAVIPAQAVREAPDHLVRFDLPDPGIHVRQGDVLAVALRTRTGFYEFLGGGPYELGSRYFRRPAIGFVTWERDELLGDFAFKTYVRLPRPAPLASPVGMLVLLAALLGTVVSVGGARGSPGSCGSSG
jgi:hypothetical protein